MPTKTHRDSMIAASRYDELGELCLGAAIQDVERLLPGLLALIRAATDPAAASPSPFVVPPSSYAVV